MKKLRVLWNRRHYFRTAVFSWLLILTASAETAGESQSPDRFLHRGYLGWITDLSSTGDPQARWPSIRIDQQLLEDHIQAYEVMKESGLTEASLWGFLVADNWSVDVEQTVDSERGQWVEKFLDAAHSRGIKVLAGLGVYSWGFGEIIKAHPHLSPGRNARVMCPSVPGSWEWQRRVIDYTLRWDFDGVSMQSADLGRCDCKDCNTEDLSDLEYHALINNRVARYIKEHYPGKIVGISGWGMDFSDPRELAHLVQMTRHVDYVIDVGDSALKAGREYRRKLINAIAPTAYGNTVTPNVEPPHHWNRERWFLPTLRYPAENLQALFQDGGRAAENYSHVLANPGDEVSIKLRAAVEIDPQSDWRPKLKRILEEIYSPREEAAIEDLLALFLEAEEAYFSIVQLESPQGAVIRLEPLVSDRPGPPIYLTQRMGREELRAYRERMMTLRSVAESLVKRVANAQRMETIVGCITNVIAEVDSLLGE